MRYNELKYLTAHNAYAAPEYGYPLSDAGRANQAMSITEQLEYGVRGLMLDIYDLHGDLVCLHSIVGMRVPPSVKLSSILKEIEEFLARENNAEEIVTIFFEDHLSKYETLATELSNTKYWFKFSDYGVAENGWPEVKTMVANGHRIVAFLENGRNQEGLNLPYLYDYAVETVYGDRSLNHNAWVRKRDESLDLSGGSGKLPRKDTLAIINHFQDIPIWVARDYEKGINSKRNLVEHIHNFYDEHDRTPNTIATDFIGTGSHLQALDHLKRIKPDFIDLNHSGWLVGNSVDHDRQVSFQIPEGHVLVGVKGYDEGGYGLIDFAFCHAPANGLGDTEKREWSEPLIGAVTESNHKNVEERTVCAPPGMAVDGITVAKHRKYGLVNLKIRFGSKDSEWLTQNESDAPGNRAEMVREGQKASSAICKIAVRSEGGHGLVDLKYYWRK